MKTTENYVSWPATFSIWWRWMWRVILFNLFFYLFNICLRNLSPIFYTHLVQFENGNERICFIIPLVANALFVLYVLRDVYTDSYPTFILEAQSKISQRTAFAPDRKLPSHLALVVWWALAWRTMLVPCGVVAGHLMANMAAHPHVENYSYLIDPVLLRLSVYALVVFSFWGTRESLRDHYSSFRFRSLPKNIYDGT